MIDNILINTIIPLLFAYGQHHHENAFKDQALKWLEQVPAEKNLVTKGFASLQVLNKTAFDSQSLLELKNEYCNKRRCLDCRVGNKLLKN